MAELHISDLDDETMRRLRERAEREGRSVETLVREIVTEATSSSDLPSSAEKEVLHTIERLQTTAPSERYSDVQPVKIEGIPASELLIRDRRR